MANLTKEQRLAREAEKEAQRELEIRAELESKLRAEFEEKFKSQLDEVEMLKQSLTETLNKQSDIENENKSSKTTIKKAVKIPLDTIVPVVCNVYGGAIYNSKKINGYSVEWNEYGSVEYMELSELVSMRNTDRRFFEDNWVVLEDVEDYTALEIYDFLRVTKHYEKVFTPENINTIFELEPSEIIRMVSGLSDGMKSTVASIAKTKIDNKELDSNKKIEALEEVLHVQFSV